jgi:hypothetical protein
MVMLFLAESNYHFLKKISENLLAVCIYMPIHLTNHFSHWLKLN